MLSERGTADDCARTSTSISVEGAGDKMPAAKEPGGPVGSTSGSATPSSAGGVDRRAFLRSAGGVAAALATYNLVACSSKGGPSAASTTTTSAPGGSFSSPAPEDIPACEQALGGNGEFIFDVHTHHVMPDRPW